MLISSQQQVGNLARIDKGICRNLHVAEIPVLLPAIEKLQRRDPRFVQIHARQKRELAQDFLAEIGMTRRVLQILLREKSDVGQFDDESLHGLEITKGDYRGEGKG